MVVDEVESIKELGKIMVVLLYKKNSSSNIKLLMQQEAKSQRPPRVKCKEE